MNKFKYDKKAAKKSLFSSVSRVISIGLGAGAGSILHNLVGDGLSSWLMASGLAIASFFSCGLQSMSASLNKLKESHYL